MLWAKNLKNVIFSVVTKISTYGDTLKHQDWSILNHFSDTKHHVNSDYETQIDKNDDNKGHIVDFRKIMYKKIDIFFHKKNHKKFFDVFSNIS